MKLKITQTISLAAFAVFLITLVGGCSTAGVSNKTTIQVKNAWVRAMPPTAKHSAAYLMLENTGEQDDELISATSEISGVTEIHSLKKNGGMMEMGPVDSVPVPAGGSAHLKPGGFHLMLIHLKSHPQPGDRVNLVLELRLAGKIPVTAQVKEGAPMMKMGQGHGGEKGPMMEMSHPK